MPTLACSKLQRYIIFLSACYKYNIPCKKGNSDIVNTGGLSRAAFLSLFPFTYPVPSIRNGSFSHRTDKKLWNHFNNGKLE